MNVMKKLATLFFAAVICICAGAQARLQTKKFRISDFPQKTMKVVLSGHEMLDAAFRQEIQKVWNLSPYEFCTMKEFESYKKSPDFYFMILTETKFRKDAAAGIITLTLYKGDKAAKSNVDGLYEVVSLPFCSTGTTDGREITFMPALITIFQNQIRRIMDRELNPSSGATVGISKVLNKWTERVVIEKDDFAFEVGRSLKAIYAEENLDVSENSLTEKYLIERTPGYLVGYVISPEEGRGSATSYVMLINASTWELYYIRKRNASVKNPAGFDKVDTRFIFSHKAK